MAEHGTAGTEEQQTLLSKKKIIETNVSWIWNYLKINFNHIDWIYSAFEEK